MRVCLKLNRDVLLIDETKVSVLIKHFDCEQLNWLFVIHNLQ